jgi:hypothetical protein
MEKKITVNKSTGKKRSVKALAAVLLTALVALAASATTPYGRRIFSGTQAVLAAEEGTETAGTVDGAQAKEAEAAETADTAGEAGETAKTAETEDGGENGEGEGDANSSGGFFFTRTHIIISCLVAFAIAVVIAVVQANKKFK